MEKAVFIDRDGVINEMIYSNDHGFADSPFKTSQFKIINGVPGAISLLKSLGFKIIIVSNQPGIAKKHFSKKTFDLMKKKMHKILKKHNAFLDDEFYCFHHPDSKIKKYKKICDCRKPKTRMVEDAVAKHHIDIKKSYVIGDGIVDMEMAKKVKSKSIFVGNVNSAILALFKKKKLSPHYIVKDLLEAANLIKKFQCEPFSN